MKPSYKKVSHVLCAVFAAYVVSYVIDSHFGGYWPKPVSGRYTYEPSGLGIPTLLLWQPYIGYNDRNQCDLAGGFYSPLIKLDQALWHRTLDLFTPEDEEIVFGTNGLSSAVQWHPCMLTMP